VNSLRQFLLVSVLFFAQLLAGAHAIGHAADNERGLPTHTCEFCLAAHDLGSGLASLAALPLAEFSHLLPEELQVNDRAAFPPPVATQRAPPIA
jgi:hypothetical protein